MDSEKSPTPVPAANSQQPQKQQKQKQLQTKSNTTSETTASAKPQQQGSSKQSSNEAIKAIQQQPTTNKPSTKQENINSVASQVYRLALFDHLPRKQAFKDPDSIEEDRILHPATVHLGMHFQRGNLQNDDDRAQALLTTMMRVIADYRTPPMMNLREDLDRYIVKQVQYLVDCRQISKGMGNIIRYIRLCISKISPEMSEDLSKSIVGTKLQAFFDDRILFAGENIAKNIISSLAENEVILTFGSSPLLRRILTLAIKSRTFRLIVVDTRPLNEGLKTVAAVSEHVNCTYCPLSGVAFALKDVTKVLLGASSLLSNGCMLASAGTAMVASLAKSKQIPVIVCAETYKFSDKVQLDSIVFNELGHSSEIVRLYSAEEQQQRAQLASFGDGNAAVSAFGPQLEGGYRGSADKLCIEAQDNGSVIDTADLIALPGQQIKLQKIKVPFEVVNLRYDLTPLANISAIATESGLIPPTSVPILIRENQSEVVGE